MTSYLLIYPDLPVHLIYPFLIQFWWFWSDWKPKSRSSTVQKLKRNFRDGRDVKIADLAQNIVSSAIIHQKKTMLKVQTKKKSNLYRTINSLIKIKIVYSAQKTNRFSSLQLLICTSTHTKQYYYFLFCCLICSRWFMSISWEHVVQFVTQNSGSFVKNFVRKI